ncbi:NADH-quinone oxidoreductase subunit 8 [bacterium HR19]|nr:NADH-quinone oxidoreductase subunit 8 [bacterium HR19]
MGIEISELIAFLVRSAVVIFLLLNIVPLMVFLERKVAAFVQDRIGPEKSGLYGLIQPLADAVKFFLKEEFIPPEANKFIYYISPIITAVTPILGFVVIPIIPVLQPISSELSALTLIAFASMGVWGLLLGGWSSNNKFSLLGSLRSASQFISYEVPLSASILAMLILYGTFDFLKIVQAQEGSIFKWGIFLNPLAFLVFFIASLAESARIPFDLPEAEGEIVAGYHTEYSGMKFALFFMGEYMHLTLASALMIILFLGGWNIPFVKFELPEDYLFEDVIEYAVGFVVFSVKLFLLLGLYVLIRWTLPRFRFDQLIRFSWGVLILLALISILISGVIAVF